MASFGIKGVKNNMNKIAVLIGTLLTSFSVYADHLSIDDSNKWAIVDKKEVLTALTRGDIAQQDKEDKKVLENSAKSTKKLNLIESSDIVMERTVKPNVLENKEPQINMVEDFNKLLKQAKTKRSDAQLKIGDLLYFGNELACYEQEAIRWWKQACDKLEAKACFRLGKYYFATNKKKSAHYFKMASNLGHAESQMMVYISKNKEKQCTH